MWVTIKKKKLDKLREAKIVAESKLHAVEEDLDFAECNLSTIAMLVSDDAEPAEQVKSIKKLLATEGHLNKPSQGLDKDLAKRKAVIEVQEWIDDYKWPFEDKDD